MGLKAFFAQSSSFALDNDLRIDSKFHMLMDDTGFNIFGVKNKKLVQLTDCLIPFYQPFKFEDEEEYFGVPTGREYINEFGEIIDVQIVTKESCPNRLKYKIDQSCILISSLKGAKTPALSFDFDLSKYVFSNGFYIFKVDKNWNTRFLLYLLRNKRLKYILDNHLYRGIGISSYKEEDFLKILIPQLKKSAQDEIALKIEVIEKEITQLKNAKTPTLDIINQVFSEEFGFDWEVVQSLQKINVHRARFVDFANDELKFDFSLRTKFIFNQYIKNNHDIDWVSLAKIVEVKGGKRLPKGENITDEETAFKYIRVEDLGKNGVFDLKNIKYITEENHLAIKNYIAKENDILLTIVGATIGKCGLMPIELDGENITENFARLIIKDKNKYLPEYLNYCLMSKLAQIQFDEYTGKSSQGKLAIFRVAKVVIPNLKIAKQKEIIQKIKSQLDKQKEIDEQIAEKQKKIEQLIEEAIFE